METELHRVLRLATTTSPMQLYLAAGNAFNQGNLDDAGYLFYIAQLRLRFDRACFTAKGTGGDSPFIAFQAMNQQIGTYLNPQLMGRPESFARVMERVRQWNPELPDNYSPDYEFSERKSFEAAMAEFAPGRAEFVERMSGLSKLLLIPEYFEHSKTVRHYNLGPDEKGLPRPTREEFEKAVEVLRRIEKETGIPGFATMR